MAADPVLAYAGPETRSIDVQVVKYSGLSDKARCVLGNFETSAGEASAAFADAGPLAWIAYDGDESQIESLYFVDPVNGGLTIRRVTKHERTSAIFNTVKLNLSVEPIGVVPRGQFSGLDFDARDWST